ncbi:recombinase family protein [Moritella viscosa]|uniref:recombinase family protein n=1 Tax=Moritella viscosa TaxID=80854 RepID=UPI0009130558|nr:recombinase family protein [Moritella viscosa]SHO15393.1 Recombinase, resolvase family [Moritella viscosa]SHO17856.1 Recombinase, resolvase family [Moritella viscosa]SHO19046.1 Recombinase, resolvase family [Moritella viscosa]
MNYAYLRISTDSQDVDNQRHGILEYANSHNLTGLNFIEDTVSGKKKWKDRKLGELVDSLVKGDVIIFAEISRMARSTLQVLEILENCISRGISVHITKQNIVLDGSLQAKIMATMLGLAAEIERDFISMRTKEALAARKAAGQRLGRPRGPAENLKLDKLRPDIEKYLRKDLSVRSIAKLIDQPVTTVHDYIKRYKLKDKILEPQL